MTLSKSSTSIETPTADASSTSLSKKFTHVKTQLLTLRAQVETYLALVPKPLTRRVSAVIDIADETEMGELLKWACLTFLLGWLFMVVSFFAPLLIVSTRLIALALVVIATFHCCRWLWTELDARLSR